VNDFGIPVEGTLSDVADRKCNFSSTLYCNIFRQENVQICFSCIRKWCLVEISDSWHASLFFTWLYTRYV